MTKNQLVKFLKKLIELQSFDPQNSKVPDFIVQTLQGFGINAEIINSNGFKSIVAKTAGTPRMIFNGHWDTVLPNQSMKLKKQKVTEDESFIYGLGACDMKSGVAAIVASFIIAQKENIPGVVINLVPDEEFGGENGTKILIEKGYTAPNIVICEPTNLNISLGQKGALFTKIISKGISAHGAYPNRGENAILKLLEFIKNLNAAYPNPLKSAATQEVFSQVTASVNIIRGGTAGNVVPDLCEAEIDIRVPPHISILKVENILKKLAKVSQVEITFQNLGSGWELKKNTKLFKAAVKAMTELNIKTEFVQKMGSNDGRYYANKNINIINVGPGDNKLSHTVNEKVSKDELDQAKQFYLLLSKIL